MPLLDTGTNAAVDAVVAAGGFLSAHSAWPGTGGSNELTGGSPAYARVAAVFGAASGGVRTLTSTNAINVPAGSTVAFFVLKSAATAGNSVAIFPAGGSEFEIQADATANTILAEGHGLANGNQVVFMNGTAPGGLTAGTLYYVVGAATDSFQVSATLGGSAIDITNKGDPSVVASKIIPEVYNGQGTVTPTSLQIKIGG